MLALQRKNNVAGCEVCAGDRPRCVSGATDLQGMPSCKSCSINTLRLVMTVRTAKSQLRRHVMNAMVQFATLAITTMFAAAAAVGLNWLFLRAAFLMMRPATAQRIPLHAELARGTAQLVRAYSTTR